MEVSKYNHLTTLEVSPTPHGNSEIKIPFISWVLSKQRNCFAIIKARSGEGGKAIKASGEEDTSLSHFIGENKLHGHT